MLQLALSLDKTAQPMKEFDVLFPNKVVSRAEMVVRMKEGKKKVEKDLKDRAQRLTSPRRADPERDV